MFEQSGRVYDTGDTSPTLHTNGGGNQETKILTPEKKASNKKTHSERVLEAYGI